MKATIRTICLTNLVLAALAGAWAAAVLIGCGLITWDVCFAERRAHEQQQPDPVALKTEEEL